MSEPARQTDCNPREPGSCAYELLSFVSGDFGLAESARQTLRRMRNLKIPVSIRDIDTGDHRRNQNHEFAELLETRPHHWPGQIKLFHLNPPEFESLVLRQHPNIPMIGQLNVIVPYWELPILPEDWVHQLTAMDCVLAPTHFIKDVISKHCPDKPVIHFPQKVTIADVAQPDRARFDLPSDSFVFLCAFDAMSCAERKNPWAAITAFKKAFTGTEKVKLIIKANNPQVDKVGEKLHQMIGDDPRIQVISEMLPRKDLEQLYASCDALVSLHRSEGLGLFIMEMMAQSKPCIVTAWSGNMDFTSAENSCLVDFEMIPVKSSHPSYQAAAQSPGAQWADADTNQAADWMKKLAEDPAFCERIGTNAHNTMKVMAEEDCASVFTQLEELRRDGFRRQVATRKHLIRIKRKYWARKIEGVVKRILRGKNWKEDRKRDSG